MTRTLPDSQDITQPDTPLPQAERSRLPILLPLAAVLIGAGISAWYFLGQPQDTDLHLSGRIEGYETDVGAKVGGRINFVAVREGEEVQKGKVLVRLDDDEIQAQLKGTEARLAGAQQQERNAQAQVAALESQMSESNLNVLQSQQDQAGKVNQAIANLASIQAQWEQAKSQLKLAEADYRRADSLEREGAYSKQQLDRARAVLESAQATEEAAKKQVEAAQGALAQAKSSQYNPYIRSFQLQTLARQREGALAQLQASREEVKNAAALRQQVLAQKEYLNVVSPIDGVVTVRSVEPGVVVAAGKTLLSLVDLNTVYLRGFVPEGDIGKVKVGQAAKIFLDSDPKQPLRAKVAAVDSKASFTPENIYFKNDRVKQVFGVKLAIENPNGYAKPGMPADAQIILSRGDG